MSKLPAADASQPLTATQWLICATAGLGFAFDMYEMVVHAIILRPMLLELGPYQPGTPEFNRWAGIVLFLPFFLLRGMGAGDVKLLAALGAWLGPMQTIWLALFTSIAGGVMALVIATSTGCAFNSVGVKRH